MKKLIIIVSVFFMSILSSAQEYEISEVLELQKDLTARVKNIKDSNGTVCAFVRVNVPSVNGIHFETAIVGTPEFLPGEYNVFISNGTKSLAFDVNGKRYEVDFSKYNINIEEKKCYRVVLTKASTDIIPTSNITITANYDNAVVLIDGIPVGQTPLSLNNVTSGMHTLSVPNTFGVTMKDTVVNLSGDKTISLSLHKEKKKPVYVDMATPGGDTAGWYNVFGTNVKGDEGAKGVVDYAGHVLVPFEFDYIYPGIQNGYYVVTKNHKEGLYEPGKGLIVPCIYDVIVTSMSYTHDSYMPVCIDNEWGVISPTGELVVPIEYENYPQCYKNNIKVEKKDIGYGLVSCDGHIVVSPHYSSLGSFINGYALFRNNDNSVGFVDDYGKESIIPSGFSVNGEAIISSGLFPVKDEETGKWGYMDKQMNLVIPTIFDTENDYDDAPNFNQGIVQLKLNGDKVIINDKGKTIVNMKEQGYKEMEIVCQSSLSFNKGFFFTYHETDGIINNTFIKVINEEGKCGLLNVQGKVVVPCKYSEGDIQWFTDNNDNIFVLRNEKSLDVINEQQQLLFSLPLSLSIKDITDGFVMIRDSDTGSYGYLNDKGEILANCIYGYESDAEETNDDNVEESLSDNSFDITEIISEIPISEGLAILSIGDRFGFIDNKGTVKVPLKYTAVTPFENGIAFVRDQNGKWTKIYKKDL